MDRYGVKAWHPDEFLVAHLAREPAKVIMAARDVRMRLRDPPRTADEYFDTLQAQGLQRFANALRVYATIV